MAKAPKTEIVQAAETPADGKADYRITAQAPSHIGGMRRQAGQNDIRLTEDQARAELLAGHIVPKDIAPAEPPVSEPTANDA